MDTSKNHKQITFFFFLRTSAKHLPVHHCLLTPFPPYSNTLKELSQFCTQVAKAAGESHLTR